MSFLKEKVELKVEETELLAQQALGGLPRIAKLLIITALLGLIPGYFLAKSASFAYWQNIYAKFLVSAKPSFTEFKDLQISKPLIVNYGDGSYGLAVQISNPNQSLSAEEISYQLKYFDSSNAEVSALNSDAVNGKTFILPNQKKYIVVPKILSNQAIAKAQITLAEKIAWQKRSALDKVILTVSPAAATQISEPFGLAAEGTVYNNSPYQVKNIRLQFLVYDQSNRLAAVSQRAENDMKPYERRAFKQIWPNLQILSPRVEVYAQTNILDYDNLTLPAQNNGSSDLSRPEEH